MIYHVSSAVLPGLLQILLHNLFSHGMEALDREQHLVVGQNAAKQMAKVWPPASTRPSRIADFCIAGAFKRRLRRLSGGGGHWWLNFTF